MRVFLAGATGVIGIRLVPLLVVAGHAVAGMTRSNHKAAELEALGEQPVIRLPPHPRIHVDAAARATPPPLYAAPGLVTIVEPR